MGLATIQIFGEYQDCHITDLPRLCRDTGPPSLAGFVFLGFDIPSFPAPTSLRESAR